MSMPVPQTNDTALRLLPADLLNPGETVILCVKPSLKLVLLIVAPTFLTVAVLTGLAALLAPPLARIIPGGLPVWTIPALWAAAGVHTLAAILQWAGLTFVLTSRRMIRLRGVLRIDIFQCDLARIQHTRVHLGLLQRLLRIGSIGFATAGTGTIEAWWPALPHPLQVNRIINETLARFAPHHENGAQEEASRSTTR